MDYRRAGGKLYVRLDKGEELLGSILNICSREGVYSAVFHGIGAASEAVIATYIPDENLFLEHKKEGMLEVISLEGNITCGAADNSEDTTDNSEDTANNSEDTADNSEDTADNSGEAADRSEDTADLQAHAHVLYSCLNGDGQIEYFGGHLIRSVTWFTMELVIEPVQGITIGKMKDPWSEVTVWQFREGRV